MNILRKIYITAFFLFLITLFPESAVSKNQGTIPGQIRVYLFEGGTGAEDSGVKNIYASLGDTITIDVYARNFKQVPVSAIEVYFTVDDDYFDIVSQGVNNAKNQYFGHFKPFIRGEYFKNVSGSSVLPHGNNTHGDSLTANDNIFDDWQLDYAEISGIGIGGERPVSRLRHGVIATFQLIAKAPCDSITISMDKDAYYMRVSSYYDPYDPNNYFFKSFETCYITVSGIEISPPLPDISMAPDTTDSSIDLDEHVGLASIPDSLMLWSASGNNMIGVNIDPVTHVVTFQTPSGFHGYEDIEFTVDDGSGNGDSDTLRVTVDHPPRLLTNAIPDTITIHEDTLEVALILSDIVVDEDDLFSSLTWEFSTDGNVNPSVIADILFLRGAQDYNGYDRLKIKVLDAFGLGDSLYVPVKVLPVNDPPVISGLPDIEIERGDSYQFNLMNFASDVDKDPLTITYDPLVNLSVNLVGTIVTITGGPSFTGNETITFTVTDPGNLSSSDDMLVTVIPARKPPVWSAIPKVGFPQNQADSSLVLWEYVSDPDDADALLTFEVTNLEDIDDYSVNYRNGRLYLSDTDNLPGWDRLTVTAYDPDGNNSTAQFLAFVAPADGTPIVGGIPDTTIVAGTQRNWIDLDDFYYDVDNTDYEMTWTWGRQANEDSSVTVSINMFSHVAHLASYDEDVFGINRIFFTVTDPDEKFADDICIILVIEDLYKPTLNLPPKIGFVAGTQKILDLDDYVLDLQYLKSELNWSWTGNSNASITTEEPDLVNTNPVSFSGPSDWTGWESVIFNVTNPIDGSAQDTLTVFSVSDDGTPVAGGLTDLTLNAGECIYVNLNDFFYDANSMDYEMTWTVTGNDSINVNIDPVTHIAQICALSELWSGQELFTFTVTDPESNFDTMNVRVIVTNPFLRNIFSAMIFRNPMQEDYMDIYIKSKIDILTLPSLKIQSELDTTSVSVQLVTKNLFYGRYLLTLVNSLGVKGIADVIMSGTTLDQMSIQDTTHFAYGRIDDDGGKIALGKMNLSVPAGALEKPVFITVVPGEIEEKQLSKTIPDEVVFDNITYTVGPSTISSTVPLSLLFSINQRTEGAGIYRLNDNSWEFIGADYSEGAVQAGIFGGDTFVLGYDRTPPRVVIREVREGVVVLSLADYGCGINEKTIRVSSDGMELPWKFDSEHSELAVSVTGHTPDENISLDISVDDLSGNTTHEAFSTQIKAVPGQIFVEQNSPNPFNPLTTISFVITSDQTVKIEVYNIMGQKVKVLVDDFLAAGRHSVVWNAVDENGSSVSSGMYLYRVTNGTRLETRKMLLIR